MCSLCRLDAEFENHIFLHCTYTTKVWNFFRQVMSLHFVVPESVEDLFCQWGRGAKGPQGKMFLEVILLGVVWGIWKERNRRVFKDKAKSVWAVIDSIVCESSYWVLVKKKFKKFSMNDKVRDWVACISDSRGVKKDYLLKWIPLGTSSYKVNFDGTSFGNLGPAAFGWVMLDSQGQITRVKGRPLGIQNVIFVETYGFVGRIKASER